MQSLATPLKIAFFVEGMYASGVDTSTQLLAKVLRRLGQHVVVFMPWAQHCTLENSENLFLLRAARIHRRAADQVGAWRGCRGRWTGYAGRRCFTARARTPSLALPR